MNDLVAVQHIQGREDLAADDAFVDVDLAVVAQHVLLVLEWVGEDLKESQGQNVRSTSKRTYESTVKLCVKDYVNIT